MRDAEPLVLLPLRSASTCLSVNMRYPAHMSGLRAGDDGPDYSRAPLDSRPVEVVPLPSTTLSDEESREVRVVLMQIPWFKDGVRGEWRSRLMHGSTPVRVHDLVDGLAAFQGYLEVETAATHQLAREHDEVLREIAAAGRLLKRATE